ncbi:hypothetical protein M9H77_22896 [Catharanthus roseus]|uniref:Uncharacterized protein n=1 Tax=Catharanthus roseus TaxID=4058 RepID=A0ACC0AUG1_CATRO|nr:hypothetical protein M9H77_22896 [Catharanthus roseus]
MTLAYIYIFSIATPEPHPDSGEWIHLKKGVVPWRAWPNRSMWTPHHALRWDGCLVESQEGLETKVGPRADLVILGERLFGNRVLVWCLAGIDYEIPEFNSDYLVVGSEPYPLSPTMALCVSLYSGIEAALMCLDSLRLLSCAGRVGGITLCNKRKGRDDYAIV